MKYTITNVVSAFLFGVLGFFAARDALQNFPNPDEDFAIILFIILPLFGAVVGFVIGCVAVFLGHRFSQRQSDGKSYTS